jgi:hypothetical protein
MPTVAEYRRFAVGVLTRVESHDTIDLSTLDIKAHADVPPGKVNAYLNDEIGKAVGGPMQLILQLLDYLEEYTDEGLTALGWLQRAAAETELRAGE